MDTLTPHSGIAAPTADPDSRLRVMSLNCWGFPFSPDRSTRMRAIGARLAQMDLDIVGFQEAYLREDREVLSGELAAAGLVDTRYFRSGGLGSGLLVASRFPIVESDFLPFRLNGHPQDLRRPDYYARKGVGRARLATPYGLVDVYNTHLIAGYLEIGDDVYFAHRVAQAFELASYVDAMSRDAPAILTADLNATEDRLAYEACTGLSGLDDSYRTANPSDPGITVTTDIPYIEVHEPERLDYVLFRSAPDRTLRVVSSEVALREVDADFEGEILAYSDHYGVCTTFEVTGASPAESPHEPPTATLSSVERALRDGLDEAQADRAQYRRRASAAGGLGTALALSLLLLTSQRRISRRALLRWLLGALATLAFLATGLNLLVGWGSAEEIETYRSLLDELSVIKRRSAQ